MHILLKTMKIYSSFGKKLKKNIDVKFINGYATILALICFSLLIQILGLISIYTLNSAYLIQANRQSTMDLSCISQARQMIENNNFVRRCHLSLEKLILSKKILIMDKEVLFEDKNTYIQCSFDQYKLCVYYDEKGISGIDYY